MALRHFLGLDDRHANHPATPVTDAAAPGAPAPGAPSPLSATDTATIRRIVSAVEAVPEGQRRYVAAFAYVLGRVAQADLVVTDEERAAMERTVTEISGLPEAQAVLVVEIAHSQIELYGGTEDYLVTRAFREASTPDQRLALLRCCFTVAASGSTISAEESRELDMIAMELDIPDADLHQVRGDFTESFEAVQRMRGTETTGVG